MLKMQKSIALNGSSQLETGEIIATMYHTIDENGTTSSGSNVINTNLYESNKEMVRADIDEFTSACREEEDKIITQ